MGDNWFKYDFLFGCGSHVVGEIVLADGKLRQDHSLDFLDVVIIAGVGRC